MIDELRGKWSIGEVCICILICLLLAALLLGYGRSSDRRMECRDKGGTYYDGKCWPIQFIPLEGDKR